MPSARSQGSLAVTLTALTPAPARRTDHTFDQQGQQTARQHPVDLRERFPYRRSCPRLPAQGGTAASPGTAHLPRPPRPAPHAAAGYPRPRPAGRRSLRQEVPPGSIHLCMQSGLLLEHTFRLFKQVLGWTAPKIRDAGAADRWTWLIIVCHAQLRLARALAADLRRPWERPAPPGRLTPARVRRGFRNIDPCSSNTCLIWRVSSAHQDSTGGAAGLARCRDIAFVAGRGRHSPCWLTQGEFGDCLRLLVCPGAR